MCRILGCVGAAPVSIRHELLEAPNPLIRQAEEHDSGWGMAVYADADGAEPDLLRFPRAGHEDEGFRAATERRDRIFNVHLRRATMGGLALDNTHPFRRGRYSLCHNGTVLHHRRLVEPGMRRPRGQTDTEQLFEHLMHGLDPDDLPGSLRRTVLAVIDSSCFSGLNLLLSDGRRLLAYRLGIFELHWAARPGQLLVASEKMSEDSWHTVRQDVLLTLDPEDPEEPHAERLVGDAALQRAEIVKFEEGTELRGAARGAFAAERAARLAASGSQ